MIPEQEPLTPGMRVRHDQGGLLYEIEGTRRSTTGYEAETELGAILYMGASIPRVK